MIIFDWCAGAVLRHVWLSGVQYEDRRDNHSTQVNNQSFIHTQSRDLNVFDTSDLQS